MNQRLRKDANRILTAGEPALRSGTAGRGRIPAENVSLRPPGAEAGERLLAAMAECERLGYEVRLGGELRGGCREAGRDLANHLRSHAGRGRSVAILYKGSPAPEPGGGPWPHHRLAMAAAPGISGVRGAAVFSVGTLRRPNAASGGYVDEDTVETLARKGLDVFRLLRDDDSYVGLQYVDGLVYCGSGVPLTVALLRE